MLSMCTLVAFCGNPNSFAILRTQIVSFTASLLAMYSASVDDCATIDCIFDFHDIKHAQKSTRNPALDLAVSRQFWCAESVYVSTSDPLVALSGLNSSFLNRVWYRYLSSLKAPFM